MRTIKLIFIITSFFFIGCSQKYDNYAAPDSGIYGTLMDGETNDSLQLKQPGGGTVRIVEWNLKQYPSATPIDLSVKTNGTYSASQLFADTYKVFPLRANGPFQYLPGDSVTVSLTHNSMTRVDFKVVPFYRIKANVIDSSFTYTVTKSNANTGNVTQLIFMISNQPVVNENVSSNQVGNYYTNLWKIDASDAILGVQQTFTFNFGDTHLPKGSYYFRVGVVGSASSSYFNYSPIINATVH